MHITDENFAVLQSDRETVSNMKCCVCNVRMRVCISKCLPDISNVDIEFVFIPRRGGAATLLQTAADQRPGQEAQSPLHTHAEEAAEHYTFREQVRKSGERVNFPSRID